ncbi:hypothetical protein DUI87_20361 [Hirundo rustica rustica]|uniref:Uncharacterized protein n=1 Tax=Hirundo rustica rustica TaxID=333673 RepID=A0A3M0K7S2_HIRRU|nr:hypothetical protein DUI87_20361 [Hirundo rustica rustica]
MIAPKDGGGHVFCISAHGGMILPAIRRSAVLFSPITLKLMEENLSITGGTVLVFEARQCALKSNQPSVSGSNCNEKMSENAFSLALNWRCVLLWWHRRKVVSGPSQAQSPGALQIPISPRSLWGFSFVAGMAEYIPHPPSTWPAGPQPPHTSAICPLEPVDPGISEQQTPSEQPPSSLELGEDEEVTLPPDPDVPYPDLAPVVFFCLKQTTSPRSWCIKMVCNPYPF